MILTDLITDQFGDPMNTDLAESPETGLSA